MHQSHPALRPLAPAATFLWLLPGWAPSQLLDLEWVQQEVGPVWL